METKKFTFADLLVLERACLEQRAGGGFVYINKPYSCGVDEALSHFRAFEGPIFPGGVMADTDTSKDGRATIERANKSTTITLKPLKGSRLRRPYVVQLWV